MTGEVLSSPEAGAVQLVTCRKCDGQPGQRCVNVSTRRPLKHPHRERMNDYRELISDQGAGWW